MSEPAAKQRPMIDLDEFERRLRRPSAVPHAQDDPLAELARLVGGRDDPFKTVFEQEQPHARRAAPAPLTASRAIPEPRADEQYAEEDPYLYGTIHPESYASDEAAHTGEAAQNHEDHQDYNWAEMETPVAPVKAPMADAPRSRRPLYVMVAIIAAGIAGIGVSFAYKSKSGPHELATIKAMSGPTKVQPDSPGGVDVANQDASILDRSPQPSPTGLVDHQERPVDISHQPAVAPRTILADAGGSMGAASVPVPPPPAGAISPTSQSFGIGALIEPKKVKTVSVRSDGTLLPNDTPPQMPMSAAPMAGPSHAAAQAPATGAATPKPATPKSTQRVVTTPKPQSIEQLADNGDNAEAAAPVKPKASAAAPAKPVKVATAEATDTAGGSGSFAVQLAAPASEQEAHDMTSKLAAKFGSALGGHHLTYHRAKVNDKTVFRVRVSGLSQKEAAGICEKIRAAGGQCFPAKD